MTVIRFTDLGIDFAEVGSMGYSHVIATHPTLRKLTPDQIDVVCRISKEVTYSRNQLIHRESVSEAGLQIVIDGYVKLVRTSPEGRELIVGLAGPNDLFGLCCQPILPGIAKCSARAQTRAKLITIPGAQWVALMRDHPEISHILLQGVMVSRDHCMSLSTDLVFLKLDGRLAKLLDRLSRWSRPDQSGDIELPALFSQSELASALGSTRVAVTRKIGSLVDAGVLKRRGRRIIIHDASRLKGYFERPAEQTC